jgi:hypothetical protein
VLTGAHLVLFSTDAEADRSFLADVLDLDSVDAGGGWLIFALPPTEVAVHPASSEGAELYLMCDDVTTEVSALRARGIVCSDVEDTGWGLVTHVELPSTGRIGVYQPKHPTAVEVRHDPSA